MSDVEFDPSEHFDFRAPLGRVSVAFHTFCHGLVKGLSKVYFRSQTRNLGLLPNDRAVLIAPSHRSNLDTPLVGQALGRPLRFMAKDSLFKNPFWARILGALGGFPVARGTADRTALKTAMEILARGEALVVFPEGARQEGPRIKPVFEGAVWLASKSGAPIVPVGIGGSEAAMPIGVKVPRPKPVRFVVGEPLVVANADGSRVKRDQLDAAAVELRERVQAVFDEAQEWAGSPNEPWSPTDPGIDERIESW